MFRREVVSLLIGWLILICICFWLFLKPSPQAQIAYQHLMNVSERSKKRQMKEKKEMGLTQQARYQVSKQIFLSKQGERLQSRLVSDYSELKFDYKKAEIVEHFQGLVCLMQEKVVGSNLGINQSKEDFPTSLPIEQSIRYLKADQAVYSYQTGHLEAEKVEVAHYQIRGVRWPSSLEMIQPLSQGRAEKLQVSLFKERNFKVQGFQATFHNWGSEW